MNPIKLISGCSLWLPACLLLLLGAAVGVQAVEFTVGGDQGWTTPTANDPNFYKKWTNGQNYRVNDTLHFKYEKDKHNVLVVKEEDYGRCLNNTPLESHDDGDTKIKLNRTGTWYFICGYPGHCSAGQFLSTDVQQLSTTNSTGAGGPSGAIASSTAASFIAALVAAIFTSIWIPGLSC